MTTRILSKAAQPGNVPRVKLPVTAVAIAVMFAAACASAGAQGITRIDTVPAPSLAANLLGDPAWPQVSVYLPPSYSKQPRRRYPVLYWLHGFTSTDRELI